MDFAGPLLLLDKNGHKKLRMLVHVHVHQSYPFRAGSFLSVETFVYLVLAGSTNTVSSRKLKKKTLLF